MADATIRQEFIDGVQEIYTTLLTNGSENDGVYFYPISENTINVYQESKYKHYLPPVLLVCKAQLTPTHGAETVEEIKDVAVFTVPLKSLTDNGLLVTHEALDFMRRGMMKFHDVWYTIDNVSPTVFVEDVFLLYRFDCTENKVFDEEEIIIDEETLSDDPDPEGNDQESVSEDG